ncbi:MAG: right-handed parallel beta-helix repeat-containing protein, partial [Candidatus Omnitrophota bacterium]|nr:right-handed parallel beta-helix repeat-containing protein [Candidatus Omnitrophota bacterium]
KFFTDPKNARTYIDDIRQNNIVHNNLPDATLGGIFPNFTPADWNYILSYGPEFEEEPAILWNAGNPSVKLDWKIANDPNKSNIVKYEIYRSTTNNVDKTSTKITTIIDKNQITFTDSAISSSTNIYYYRLYTYYEFGGPADTAEAYSGLGKAVLRLYVDISYIGGDDDGSKLKPYSDLGEGIWEVTRGTKVCVAEGVYPETDSTLNMWNKDGFILEGGYESTSWTRDIALNETIIDGTGLGGWNVISFSNATGGTLDGFTVTGAFMTNDACGVRIDRSSSIVIRNCKIINNYRGIGMWISPNSRVENCQITQSSIQGIQVDRSSLDISDSVLTGNSASQLNAWTPAIDVYTGSALTAARLFVSENKGRGIAVNNISTFDVRDSVIANNLNRGFDSYNSYGKLF